MRTSKSAVEGISIEQNDNKIVFERYINMRPAVSMVDHEFQRSLAMSRYRSQLFQNNNNDDNNIFSNHQMAGMASNQPNIEQLDIERPRQLVRVRSFMYRSFQQLSRSSLRKWLFNTLGLEILFIASLFCLNLTVKMHEVKTNFSRYEKRWINMTLNELICVFIGFTLFRVLTLNLATSDDRFFNNLIGLIIFQITLNVIFLVVQLNSLTKMRQI